MPTDLYVSPRGCDENPGTKAKPLATLAGARNAVRKLKRAGKHRTITVLLAGGTYRLTEPVVFGTADSAPAGGTITYSAAPGAKPVFSAGTAITDWQKLTRPPKGLPAKAAGKVYVADLPDGLDRFYTLFDGETRLPRARCKGFAPPGKASGWNCPDRHAMRFPAGAMRRWDNLPDVEFSIVTSAPWTMNVLGLESIDMTQRVARTVVRGTYGLTKPRFGKFLRGNVFVENVFEGLDAPGRWVLDSAARKLYLWPRKAKPGSQIIAPLLTELVRVEGKIDYDGPRDTPVRGIIFRGLTLTHGDRYTWADGQEGWGLQHDWEFFDRSTALLRFRGTENCAAEYCRFANAGGTAVRLDLHAAGNRIENNLIEHVGGAGVLLAGYGPGTKDVNRGNRVVNNHIHHVGETYWHSSAIFAWQSSANCIAHNHIHNVPYTGIVVSGRIGWDPGGHAECSRTVRWKEIRKAVGKDVRGLGWRQRERFLHARRNVVEYNDIHDVMETLEDGNCIYVSGCGGGNIVRSNYLHHCESIHMAEGIRCDDDQHDTIIDSNILFRLGGLATYIAIKGINHITNNILACPASPTFRGMLSLEHVPVDGSVIQRNIFLGTGRKHTAVYQGRTYYKTEAWLRDCNADFNCYHNTGVTGWGDAHLKREQAHGIELHSIAADPMFVNVRTGDFHLRKGSPVEGIGFVPIDVDRIGLTGQVGPAGAKAP